VTGRATTRPSGSRIDRDPSTRRRTRVTIGASDAVAEEVPVVATSTTHADTSTKRSTTFDLTNVHSGTYEGIAAPSSLLRSAFGKVVGRYDRESSKSKRPAEATACASGLHGYAPLDPTRPGACAL
jgi:hypothetical protein